MITVIRHKETEKGFAIVVTNTDSKLEGFEVRLQTYRIKPDGYTVLDIDEGYRTEESAINNFNLIQERTR